jgi:N-acetylglutamate synthase
VTQPDEATCLRAMEATWPSARAWQAGGFVLRDGAGGGKRVSAASPIAAHPDFELAEADMIARGQVPLFQLRPEHTDLHAALATRGYRVFDPTLIYVAPIATLAAQAPAVRLFDIWPPLAIMAEIWAAGGIGRARLAVMARAPEPRTGLVARIEDRAAGAAFCAVADGIAMIHAVEVARPFRRKGLGQIILRGAAHWAQAQGAAWFGLAVTEGNTPARALYERAGMHPVTRYYYMQKDVTHG